METQNRNNAPFSADQVNWEELSAIGILRDELELDGHLDTLLKGERTDVISLRLSTLGIDMEVDATLRFVRKGKGESPILEITGIAPSVE